MEKGFAKICILVAIVVIQKDNLSHVFLVLMFGADQTQTDKNDHDHFCLSLCLNSANFFEFQKSFGSNLF